MSEKEKFVNMVERLFEENEVQDEQVLNYFEKIKKKKTTGAPITERGIEIVQFMQSQTDKDSFYARDIAEGLFTSSRSVSGAMRKLVTDGYVDKDDQSPIGYSLTDKGREFKVAK